MDVAALAVAIVSIVLAVAALLWHVLAWFMTGSWVRVKWSHGYPVGPAEEYGDVLVITAVNVGRSPVEVTGWGLELPGGDQLPGHVNPLPWVPAVPHTLPGGHEQSWHMPKQGIVSALRSAGYTSAPKLRPFVILAGGKRKRARRAYTP